jgi:lipopolysaccharide transport system ATP-binding protein
LEPEILIVDEVLAVGDAQFQKKCLGKMEDVGKEGRTVIFVSHQMAAIQNLCQRVIWLNQGQVINDDQTHIAISKYLSSSSDLSSISLADRKDRKGDGRIRFTSVEFQNEYSEKATYFCSGQNVKIVLFFKNTAQEDLEKFNVAIGIDNQIGERITNLSTEVAGSTFHSIRSNTDCLVINIKKLPLTPGRYGFTIFSTVNSVIADWISNAGFFEVEGGDFYNTGKLPPAMQGNFLLNYTFNTLESVVSN